LSNKQHQSADETCDKIKNEDESNEVVFVFVSEKCLCTSTSTLNRSSARHLTQDGPFRSSASSDLVDDWKLPINVN